MVMSAEDGDLLNYPFKVEPYASYGTYIGPNMSPTTSKTAITTLKAGEVFERFSRRESETMEIMDLGLRMCI
jgi:hypothetical protein